jgi:hypothetical protein
METVMLRFLRFTAVLLSALAITSTATVAAVPVLRHATLAWLQDPADLPAAQGDGRVHYEGDARAYAEEVARLLPEAIATVERMHGRPFGRPPIVTVFADDDAYARANGSGSTGPVGTTFSSRVSLAPILWTERREQLRSILTHELSHAHLQSLIGTYAFAQIPSWFNEGLAVMVSGGGGAANVSETTARDAIHEGHVIAVSDHTSIFGSPFDPPQDRTLFPVNGFGQHMIYRQAGMFVAYLREHDPSAFHTFMDALMNGTAFRPAFESAYGHSLSAVWHDFATG